MITLEENVPERWPLVVAMAALPTLRSNRGPGRLPTYLERAEWHELEQLFKGGRSTTTARSDCTS